MLEEKPMIELKQITKKYGSIHAVNDLSLAINKGELVTLLGASGCGKTTTLKCITGQHYPDQGQVCIDGEDITNLSTYKRNLGMVFQNFALFPHKTIFENVEFPLKLRKYSKRERYRKVSQVLKMVQLVEHDNKYPRQLSGGQQQRVSLARAMVYEPKVILFDEPLSNLDAKLRQEMRYEIKELQRRMGLTAVYVTHDQEEALALSHRIAIMNNGRIEQFGSPKEIYSQPKTAFVAQFIGVSNFLQGEVLEAKNGQAIFRLEEEKVLKVRCPEGEIDKNRLWQLMVRPSQIEMYKEHSEKEHQLSGKVLSKIYLGELCDYTIEIKKGHQLKVQAGEEFQVGEKVSLSIPANVGWLVPAEVMYWRE